MGKWQYAVDTYTHDRKMTLESFLNEYGQFGWELVSVENSTFIFKRRIA